MIERLEALKKRYDFLTAELLKEEVYNDFNVMMKYNKEKSDLEKTISTYNEYKQVLDDLEAAKEMSKDPEMAEFAREEIETLSQRKIELEDKLTIMLLPKDPNDEKNVIVEIRGAAGGDEGNIFAGDLYRMYGYYADSLGYKTQVMEASESEAGGYTLISFLVKGHDAYRHFKFESGAHRVQRVPKTETQGRIHTSTATVLVLPDVEEADIEIPDSDLEIETHRASGAGGQHINKTDSAVRITHKPTGISVNCQDGRSQIANRETALKIIRARVYEEYARQRAEKEGAIRKSKIGTGDRSEKIRTYNYPQNRVSDHRIGLTITQLDRIIDGKLDDVVNALLENEQKEKLLNENVQ